MLGELFGTVIDFISDQFSKTKLSALWVFLFTLSLLFLIFAFIAIMEGHTAMAVIFLILSIISVGFYIQRHTNN